MTEEPHDAPPASDRPVQQKWGVPDTVTTVPKEISQNADTTAMTSHTAHEERLAKLERENATLRRQIADLTEQVKIMSKLTQAKTQQTTPNIEEIIDRAVQAALTATQQMIENLPYTLPIAPAADTAGNPNDMSLSEAAIPPDE